MADSKYFVKVTAEDVDTGTIETVIDGKKIKVPLTAHSMANGIRLKKLGNLAVDAVIEFYPDMHSFEASAQVHPNAPRQWFEKSVKDAKPTAAVTTEKDLFRKYLLLIFFGFICLLSFYPLVMQSSGLELASGYLADARLFALLPEAITGNELWYEYEVIAHRAFFIIFIVMAPLIVFYLLERQSDKIIYNRNKAAALEHHLYYFATVVSVVALLVIAIDLIENELFEHIFAQAAVQSLILLFVAALLAVFFKQQDTTLFKKPVAKALLFTFTGLCSLVTFYHPDKIDSTLYDIVNFADTTPELVEVPHDLNAEAMINIADMTNEELAQSAAEAISQDDSRLLLLLLNEMKKRRLALPDSFYFIYAKALFDQGLYAEAKTFTGYYLKHTGYEGSYASEAKRIVESH